MPPRYRIGDVAGYFRGRWTVAKVNTWGRPVEIQRNNSHTGSPSGYVLLDSALLWRKWLESPWD